MIDGDDARAEHGRHRHFKHRHLGDRIARLAQCDIHGQDRQRSQEQPVAEPDAERRETA